jgi:hypothetical protein
LCTEDRRCDGVAAVLLLRLVVVVVAMMMLMAIIMLSQGAIVNAWSTRWNMGWYFKSISTFSHPKNATITTL